MLTRWDFVLWLSGFMAGGGCAFLLMRFIPQRLAIDLRNHVHHTFAIRVDHPTDGEDWKNAS